MNMLESQFEGAMFDIYRRAKAEARYNATIFLDMLTRKNGLATAKQLISAPMSSNGYTALHERKRLDLTVEAVVVESLRWRTLFTPDELIRAEKRLVEYRYQPKPPS